jgi:biopolymer transport protein ExbB
MKTLRGTIGFLCLAIATSAEDPGTSGAMKQLSRSAEQDLGASIQELDRLREQISAEKLPMAQELTALEEKLGELRREHERVRARGRGNLGLTTLKTEMRARQDELDYVGNLLDDYARTFESKVNVCELQYCGTAIERAKQAGENTALPLAEKLAQQTEFVDVSLQRSFDAIGGMRFSGVGVDMQGEVVKGQYAIFGPVALFSSDAGAGGVVVPQSGSANPLIRPLEGAMQAGIATLVMSGEGILQLDPSRGGALKALVQRTNLIHIFEKGGPIMWPLLFASILALGTVIERVIFILNERRKRDPKTLEKLFGEVERGDTDGAVRTSKDSKDYVVRTLGYALDHRGKSLTNALLFAQTKELKRFRRGISVLDTVITLAPLLGLLGTVTGMMGSFSLIRGELSAPARSPGIAGVITLAFGRESRSQALLPFNF